MKGPGEGCRRNRADMRGYVSGRLKAIEPTERRDRKGSIIWRCQCACGNTAYVSQDALHSQSTRSCGCLKRQAQREIPSRLHRADGTCVEWLERRKTRADNTSGFRGVCLRKDGKYMAHIGMQKKRYCLGLYDGFEEARAVRLAVEGQLHSAFVEEYHAWERLARLDPAWAREHPYKVRVVRNGRDDFSLEILL